MTLALGIGANTTVFSIADAVLLKMLPVQQPEQLIQILQPTAPPGQSTGNYNRGSGFFDRFSFAQFVEMQKLIAPFAEMVADTPPDTTQLAINGNQGTVRHTMISGNYFAALGVRPIVGRVTEGKIDGERGRHPVAVISHTFWERDFASDPGVLGRTVQIGATQYQIIGVTQPGFFGLQIGSITDIWTPVIMASEGFLRGSSRLRVIARLNSNTSAQEAAAPLQVWFQNLLRDRFATAAPGSNQHRFASTAHLKIIPAAKGMSPLREKYAEPIAIVSSIVGIILLLACANIANLLLARASVRQREMAIRTSVGAGRWRLLRQLLAESLLLSLVAAAAGVMAARWTAPLLVSMLAPSATPVQLAIELDIRVFSFVAAIALFTTIACGIVPALRASRVDIHSALKSGTALAAIGHAWQSRALVVLQMVLSLVLLVVSALFVRTLLNLKSLDPGFDRENVLIAIVQFRPLPNAGKPGIYQFASDDQLCVAWQELLRRVAAIPGVESASAAVGGPLFAARRGGEPRVANMPWDSSLPPSWFIPISANYFRTFGRALLQGRDFEPRDFEPTASPVAVINETMSHRFFGNNNPIGRRLNDHGPKPPPGAPTIEIIGVAADMKFDSLRTAPPWVVYVPFPQNGVSLKLGVDIMGVSIRTRRDSGSLERVLRQEIAAANPAFALRSISSQTRIVDETLLRERLLATVGSFFGVLALLLASIGLYGTMSCSVARRTQEIGIRMALGAGQQQVLRMVLTEALGIVVFGSAIGIMAALVAGRTVSSILFGLEPWDPGTFVLATAILAATSVVAAVVPALRACGISPMQALRNE